uniref:Uncharacterized protein n=1 Tax=Fagus sylvatica TaxID=28930 RepID=A0A2N9HMN1_FAGSY
MRHTVGKLTESTFQRYKIRVNWSSDRKVMAPKSRGVGVVFSVKIPAKRGMLSANRELRLVAGVVVFLMHLGLQIKSQRVRRNPHAKAVVWEENHVRFSARFPYFLSVFVRTVDLAPDVGFRRSWYRWKACATLFLKVLDLQETELGFARHGPANRGHRSVFGSPEGNFLIEIPVRPGKILAIRELHLVLEHVLSLKVMGLEFILQRVRKNLCASTALSGGKLKYLGFNSAWLESWLDGSDLGSEARWLGFWLEVDLGLAWSDHGSMARIAAQWLRGSDLEMVLARDLSSMARWLGSISAHENRIKKCLILDSVTRDGRSETWWFRRCWWRVSEDLKLFPARGGALMLGMDSGLCRLTDLGMSY